MKNTHLYLIIAGLVIVGPAKEAKQMYDNKVIEKAMTSKDLRRRQIARNMMDYQLSKKRPTNAEAATEYLVNGAAAMLAPIESMLNN